MKKLFKSILIPWLSGKAYSKIDKEQYAEAIELLLKITHIEQNSEAREADYYHLGFCYFKCKDFNKALPWFEKSYNRFNQKKTQLESSFYKSLLYYYSQALRANKLSEKATILEREYEKVCENSGKSDR